MKYTDLEIEAIKLFGRKDLTFGCLIFRKEKQIIHQMDSHDMPCDEWEIWRERGNAEPYLLTKDFEILWHIPHLEDLFRVAEEKWKVVEVRNVCYSRIELFTKDNPFPLCVPYNPTLPLLEQSEETLNQICNLFK